jgi:hypothetical protein
MTSTLPVSETIFVFDDPTSTLPEDVRMNGSKEGLLIEDLNGKVVQTLPWAGLRDMLAYKQDEEDMMDEFHIVLDEHSFVFECEDAFGVRGICILFQKQFTAKIETESETAIPCDPYDEEELKKTICYAPGQVFRLIMDGESEVCSVQSVDQQSGDHEVLIRDPDADQGLIKKNSSAPKKATVKNLAVKSHAPESAPPFFKIGGRLFKTHNSDAPHLKTGMYTITQLELLYTATVKHANEADDNVKQSINDQVTELVKKFTSVPLQIEHIFTKAVTFQFAEQTQSGHHDVVTEILAANRKNRLTEMFPKLKVMFPNIEAGLKEFSRKKTFYKVMYGKKHANLIQLFF